MLDPSIREQLTTHFSSLSSKLTFALFASEHPKQAELRELLSDVVSTSPKLGLAEIPEQVTGVCFDLLLRS